MEQNDQTAWVNIWLQRRNATTLQTGGKCCGIRIETEHYYLVCDATSQMHVRNKTLCWLYNGMANSGRGQREIKFIGLFEDIGHRGPYKPFNHNFICSLVFKFHNQLVMCIQPIFCEVNYLTYEAMTKWSNAMVVFWIKLHWNLFPRVQIWTRYCWFR